MQIPFLLFFLLFERLRVGWHLPHPPRRVLGGKSGPSGLRRGPRLLLFLTSCAVAGAPRTRPGSSSLFRHNLPLQTTAAAAGLLLILAAAVRQSRTWESVSEHNLFPPHLCRCLMPALGCTRAFCGRIEVVRGWSSPLILG